MKSVLIFLTLSLSLAQAHAQKLKCDPSGKTGVRSPIGCSFTIDVDDLAGLATITYYGETASVEKQEGVYSFKLRNNIECGIYQAKDSKGALVWVGVATSSDESVRSPQGCAVACK